jgi:NAD(P)-dependent dehydrogenase (short-subunit alcohol dehydrogenase family)
LPEAFVTGGGRGIGANIARRLASDGWNVTVAARTIDQVDAVADEIGGRAIQLDVSDRTAVERAFAEVGPVDLLVANAGILDYPHGATWELDPGRWWRVLEVNVLGVHLCCRAAIPGMLEHGEGRIVITGGWAGHTPGMAFTAYPASKAAVCRYGETLANELAGRIAVFVISPGLVRTAMTEGSGEQSPWASPDLAPDLVCKLASGRYDVLAGRFLDVEHDDVDDLVGRIDEIRDRDLNAIRLRR